MKVVVRQSDQVVFEPSYPDGYDEGCAVADCLSADLQFYFREVKWLPRRWWQIKGRWKRTGKIWQPADVTGWDVVQFKRGTIISA